MILGDLCNLGISWEILNDLDQSWVILGDLGGACAVFGDLGQSWAYIQKARECVNIFGGRNLARGPKLLKCMRYCCNWHFVAIYAFYFGMQMTKGHGGKYTRGLIVPLSKVDLKNKPPSVYMMLMNIQFSF